MKGERAYRSGNRLQHCQIRLASMQSEAVNMFYMFMKSRTNRLIVSNCHIRIEENYANLNVEFELNNCMNEYTSLFDSYITCRKYVRLTKVSRFQTLVVSSRLPNSEDSIGSQSHTIYI